MPHHLLLKGSTLWALINHFDPPVTGLPSLTKAGASTIEVSDLLLTPAMLEQIAQNRLGLIIQTHPLTPDDINATLALAKQSRAVAINTHIRTPHIDHDDAVQLVKGLISRATDASIPLYCETHRGCLTQDLYRTAKLAEVIPEMRFTLDVSHYVLSEEQPGPTEKLAALLDIILDRTEMIHGRISNGQQIQQHTVDPTSDLAQSYKAFWTEAMRRWRMRKPAGSTLIFTPELGPPPYAILDKEGNELSNRLEQTETIWEIAQAAWKQSASAGSNRFWPCTTNTAPPQK